MYLYEPIKNKYPLNIEPINFNYFRTTLLQFKFRSHYLPKKKKKKKSANYSLIIKYKKIILINLMIIKKNLW